MRLRLIQSQILVINEVPNSTAHHISGFRNFSSFFHIQLRMFLYFLFIEVSVICVNLLLLRVYIHQYTELPAVYEMCLMQKVISKFCCMLFLPRGLNAAVSKSGQHISSCICSRVGSPALCLYPLLKTINKPFKETGVCRNPGWNDERLTLSRPLATFHPQSVRFI